MNQDILRRLPSIDELMSYETTAGLLKEHDHAVVVNAARAVVDKARSEILSGAEAVDISVEYLVGQAAAQIHRKFSPSMKGAVNASGIILHTGLGRAALSKAAIDAVNDTIKSYCTLASDLETGQRQSRDVHLADLLCELTGAEAATFANNNAAATLLILNSLAKGKEVIVSRGQLVEIGGSFRMPDVMEASGAILREVGTTNKTHLSDYSAAINENTGAILKVHQSNYRIVGFTEEPSIWEICEVARKHNLPVIDDIGSGALVDLAQFGIENEPMVQDSVKAGSDVICFSGDKLIGGPQSGVIVGKASVIRTIKKNPLARALRIGKMEVAAMEATLRLFLDRDRLTERHPTYTMLSLSPDAIAKREQAAAKKLKAVDAEISVIDGASQVGSGSSPAETLPTKLLSVKPTSISAGALSKQLRYCNRPVFARVQNDCVLLDFRTVQPNEDALVVKAIIESLGKAANAGIA